MERFHSLCTIKNSKLFRELFIPALGIIPLTYVFYAGFLDLPPILTNIVIFTSIFIGLSVILYWKNNYLVAMIFFAYLGLFFLPLTWLWRGLEFDQNVLMGIFPFNDGLYYLNDAYRLMMGYDALVAPNGRPLYAGTLAFLIWVFNGNLQIALALFCIGTAIAIFLLALEIREIAGPFPAGLTSAILFYFYLPFLGRVHTESLGLSFGALALALLLKGIRRNNLISFLIGSFALSLALNTRSGAFFVLPTLILWAWVHRDTFGKKAPILLVGAIAFGFMINGFLLKLISTQQVNMFSNYGHTLYGLASGYKGWGYIYTLHPELNNNTNIFPYAFEVIRKNPTLLLVGILSSYKDYFTPQEMFVLMSFRGQQSLISWILYLLTILGLYRLVQFRDKLHYSLIIFLLVGIFLSIAFVPPIDNGLRALMSTHPINALVAGLAFLPTKNIKHKFFSINIILPEVYTIMLAIVCILGPVTVVNFPLTIPSLPTLNCPEGAKQISVMVSHGSYINIVKEGARFGFTPSVRKEDIRNRLDNYHYQKNHPYILTDFPAFKELIKKLKQGDTILIGLNLFELNRESDSDSFIFLITPTDQIKNIGGVNNFCARLSTEERLDTNRFYYEISMHLIK